MNDTDPESLAERFKIAERAVPARIDKAAVAILRTNSESTVAHGSGTLFQVADQRFVVTAAHVLRRAKEIGWGIGITGEKEIVQLPGDWLCSPQTGSQPDRGLGDIAVYKLTEAQVTDLGQREFVRVADLGLHADVTKGFFLLLGFPAMLSDSAHGPGEIVGLGAFRFATTASQVGNSLEDFDKNVHFLLDAKDDALVNMLGMRTTLRARHGVPVKLVDGVPGISGCGVWRIGRPRTAPESWTQDDARLVGVATAVYGKSEVIKVTRWKFVTKLIDAGFPDLRPSLKLLTMRKY